MKIKPCPNNPDGKHRWRYEIRKHKRRGRRFVYCLNCPQRAQESSNGSKFSTAREFADIKEVTGSYRTWKRREKKILEAGYKSINEYIDVSPVIQSPYKT